MSGNKSGKIAKAVLLFIAVLFLVVICARAINNREPYQDSVKLTDGWTVNVNHTLYSNVNLDTFEYTPPPKGEKITLSTVVPDCGFQNPVMTFSLYRSGFEVYSDDRLVYTYAMDDAIEGKMVGTGINWIQLPSDIAGKSLRIDVVFNEYNSPTNFNVPILSDASNAIKYFISENLSFICIGAFLIVFGVSLLVASIFVSLTESDSRILIYTGFFAIFTGFWLLGNKGILNLVSDNRVLNVWVEYMSLYVAPLPILLYMLKLRKGEENRWLVLPMKILIYCGAGLLVVSLFLQVTDILHFTNLLTVFHVLDFTAIAFVVFSSLYLQIKRKKTEENIVLGGIFMLTLCVGLDLVLFNLGKFVNPFFGRIVGISAWGSLFFVISMLLNFALSMYRNLSYKVEQSMLIALAFSDPLTKLSNRAKLFRTISELLGKQEHWGIVNFDLNYLKQNNDKYGHQTGDAMLKDFAGILTASFKGAAIVARVGGDEFYVLYEQPSEGQIETALRVFDSNMEAFNKTGKIYVLSAAYGVSYSTELPEGTYDDIIHLADERMYEMKQKMH